MNRSEVYSFQFSVWDQFRTDWLNTEPLNTEHFLP